METENMESLEAFFGLPKKIKYCKKCIISNQRPCSSFELKHTIDSKKATIQFDEHGVCDACRYAEIKAKTNWEQREKELWKLCDKHRSDGKKYDCIIPGSGGKDSVFTAHILKNKFEMHPLTITWAPHLYTDIGWKNFQNWIQNGFDNILISPNGQVHRLLAKLAFKNLLFPFQPFIFGQKNLSPKFALMYDAPLIFYGENESEYGNRLQGNESPLMDMAYYSYDAPELDFSNTFLAGVSINELMKKYQLKESDLQLYLPPRRSELKKRGVAVHYLGFYIKWDPQEMYYYAVENCGFQANPQRRDGTYSKYSSLDDKLDDLHFYTTFIKFGIGKATYDAAQEIRNNKITRKEGVDLVRKFDGEFPARYFNEILEYLGIDKKEFTETIDNFRSPHLWKKENGQWKLRHQVTDIPLES